MYKRAGANRDGSTVSNSDSLETVSREKEVVASKMGSMKILVFFAGLIAVCSAGLIPGGIPAAIPAAIAAPIPAALTVGTYATSYNAHAVNHAFAAPYIASPVLAHAVATPFVHPGLHGAALVAGRR